MNRQAWGSDWEVTKKWKNKPRTIKKSVEGIGNFTVWRFWDRDTRRVIWQWGVGIEGEKWQKCDTTYPTRRSAVDATFKWAMAFLKDEEDREEGAPKLRVLEPCSCCACQVLDCELTWAKDGDYCRRGNRYERGDICERCEGMIKEGPCEHIAWEDAADIEELECPNQCDEFLLWSEERAMEQAWYERMEKQLDLGEERHPRYHCDKDEAEYEREMEENQ